MTCDANQNDDGIGPTGTCRDGCTCACHTPEGRIAELEALLRVECAETRRLSDLLERERARVAEARLEVQRFRDGLSTHGYCSVGDVRRIAAAAHSWFALKELLSRE